MASQCRCRALWYDPGPGSWFDLTRKEMQFKAPALCNQPLTTFPSACLRNMNGKLPFVSSEAIGLTGRREATCGTNRALLKRRKYVC